MRSRWVESGKMSKASCTRGSQNMRRWELRRVISWESDHIPAFREVSLYRKGERVIRKNNIHGVSRDFPRENSDLYFPQKLHVQKEEIGAFPEKGSISLLESESFYSISPHTSRSQRWVWENRKDTPSLVRRNSLPWKISQMMRKYEKKRVEWVRRWGKVSTYFSRENNYESVQFHLRNSRREYFLYFLYISIQFSYAIQGFRL